MNEETQQINKEIQQMHTKWALWFSQKPRLATTKPVNLPWEEKMLTPNELEALSQKLTQSVSISEFKNSFNPEKPALQVRFSVVSDFKTAIKNYLDFPELVLEDSNAETGNVTFRSNGFNWNSSPCAEDISKKCLEIHANFYDLSQKHVQQLKENGGHIQLKLKTGYSHHKITARDIGKSIVLKEQSFKIIDVYDNKLLVDAGGANNPLLSRLPFINLDSQGDLVSAYDYRTFQNLQKQATEAVIMGVNARTQIEAENYTLFKENPTISLENYTNWVKNKLNVVKDHNQKKQPLGATYTLIQLPSIIENLYVYKVNYHKIELPVTITETNEKQ